MDSEEFGETLQLVPESLGQGYIKSFDLHGINILLFNYQLQEDLFIIRKSKDVPDISYEFGFHLSGDRSNIHTGENFVQWSSFNEPDEWVDTTYAKEPIRKVDIHLESAARLTQLTAKVLAELPTEIRQSISDGNFIEEIDCITPTMRSALMQIINCPFQGKTKEIYLESNCLELITLKLEQLKQRDQPTRKLFSLKSNDIDRIYLAKDILIANFDNPSSLTELARQLGLNDCTLKRGFREVFGKTAFGYLRDYRLEQARSLLLENQLSITAIAYKVGYTNRCAFRTAFRKKFGVSPKTMRRQ